MMWSILLLILCYASYIKTYQLCSDQHGILWNLQNKNLTDVPDNIPRNTTTLDLSFNHIKTIRNRTFQHLENLTCLTLSFNPISHIEKEGFRGLKKLEMLELNGHSLDYQKFDADVFLPIQNLQNLSMRTRTTVDNHKIHAVEILKNFKNLTTIMIDTAPETIFNIKFFNLRKMKQLIIGKVESFECGLQVFTNTTFQGLSDVGVEVLDLHACTALDIEDGFLKPLEDLKTFSFRSGEFPMKVGMPEILRSLRFYMNKSMTEINLNDMDLHERLIFDGLTVVSMEVLGFMENLEYLDISEQFIFNRRSESTFTTAFEGYAPKTYHEIIFFIPKKLKYLNFGSGVYRMGPLYNVKIENGHNLRYFNISLLGLFYFNVTIKGLENVDTFDISGNDVSVISETFFDTFPNVTQLRIADCFLDNDFILSHGRRLFQPLKKLEELDLSRNNLLKLPNDIFKSLNQLRIINLAFNKLFSNPDYLHTPNLHTLYLNFNNFIKFSSSEIDMFNKLEKMRQDVEDHGKLYLYGNALACTCETYSFVTWMHSSQIAKDRQNYTCIDPKGDLISTADFKKSYYIQMCLSSTLLNISVSLAAAILVIIFTVFVVVKNKLAFKIFIQRLLGKYVYPKHRQDFKYDAYIIYPESLYQLVCFDMVENVEKPGLKFYIPHRDQLFGLCKEEDITESCKNSWKLVLILNEEFMNEPLAYFTLSTCLTSITLTTPHRLILIIDSNLNILPNIEFFLQSVSESNVLYTDLSLPLSDEFWSKLKENIHGNNQDL